MKVCLVVLDGWGIGNKGKWDAIYHAKTPVMDSLKGSSLLASGEAVGLPKGNMGNSEVGHLTIGAGRVIEQDLLKINKLVKRGDFFKNEVLLEAIENVKKKNSRLHLVGLISDGGIHAHIDHCRALVRLAKKNGVKVYLHAIMDGRDTAVMSGKKFIMDIQKDVKIGSISGRYYAMDRDQRWGRTKKAYLNMVSGKDLGIRPEVYLKRQYEKGITDEFIVPANFGANVSSGDSLVFFNFRQDRARQLTRAFVDGKFDGFVRPRIKDLHFVCFTEYDKKIKAKVAFVREDVSDTLGEIISKAGMKQFRIAETEKYAHVTFFFNGGREVKYKGEDRVLVSSPKVSTYDKKPEMSAKKITDELIKAFSRNYDFYLVNYANADMVGHTGDFDATVKAVSFVDKCIGRILDNNPGVVLITGDHGNAENMKGNSRTTHSVSKVPFLVVEGKARLGGLSDVAPTVLDLLGLEKPRVMKGKSLV